MHLGISFNKLQLTRGCSYIKMPALIVNKKPVINLKTRNRKSAIKGAVIVALHHEDSQKDLQRISKLKPYSDLYNWERAGLPCDSQSDRQLQEKQYGHRGKRIIFASQKKVKARVKSQFSENQVGTQLEPMAKKGTIQL